MQMKMSVMCVRVDQPEKILGFNLNYVSVPDNTIMVDAMREVGAHQSIYSYFNNVQHQETLT